MIGNVASTTRARLLLLVSAILVPLAIFAAVMFVEFAGAERARYRADSEQTAQRLSSAIDRELVALTAALQALATSPALDPGGDLADFHRQALQVVQTPGIAIVLRDRTSRQLVNTSVRYGASLPRSVDPVLVAADQRVFETGQPIVSGLFTGAVSERNLVMVSVPVLRGGEVRAALDIALDPIALSKLLTAGAPPSWTVSLVDRSDRIIARAPLDPVLLGREVTADLRREATGASGTWRGITLDGTAVLGAYSRSPFSGWRVAVGVPIGAVEAPVRKLTALVVGSGLLVALFALLLALEVARTINRPIALLVGAAERVGRGEPVPHLETGLREVDEVAGALAAAERLVDTRETALQASEERFRAAVRAVEGVIWSNDSQGRMNGDQPGWAALTGQSYDEFQGLGWTAALHPDDIAATVTAWDLSVRDRSMFVHEHRVRRADGVYRRFSVRAIPVLDPAGAIREWVGVHTDITEEFAAKAALAAREAELRDLNATLERRVEETSAERDRIWRISTELMMVARFDGVILAVNPAWWSMLGWLEFDLRGTSMLELVHAEDLAKTEEALQRIGSGGTAMGLENRYRHRDGSYRWLAWAAVPEAGMIHAIARDVTVEREAADALRRAEEQLRQSQKMEVVGQLTGGIAHDFNNLLTVVSGNLEMASRRAQRQGLDDRMQRHLAAAQEGSRRAAVLTHRLLAFARQTPLRPETVDLNAVITDMTDLIRRTLGEPIVVKNHLEPALWPVEADRNQIENAILNLCVNARDAMPKGGTLSLETRNGGLDPLDPAVTRGDVPAGDYAVCIVRDTGTGIPPEIQERVFEPFFTTKPIGKGTGLGLSQVFGFMRQSGGVSKLESAPDQGTAIHLFFPRQIRAAERGAAETAIELEPIGRAGGETMLVIEDEDMVRDFTVAALEEAGYRVLSAGDGPSGLDLLDANPEAALLFTDMVLAGPLDGRALATEAHRRRPELKVLFTTGYTPDSVVLEGKLDAGVDIITKPFTATALIAKVRGVLAP